MLFGPCSSRLPSGMTAKLQGQQLKQGNKQEQFHGTDDNQDRVQDTGTAQTITASHRWISLERLVPAVEDHDAGVGIRAAGEEDPSAVGGGGEAVIDCLAYLAKVLQPARFQARLQACLPI